MKLYFVPRTRATRPRWMLEELGVPYDMVQLDPAKAENRTPEYLAVHPLGHVPALVDGDVTLFESAAICLYLADKFPEKRLAPPLGSTERGHYFQWIVFAMVTVEPVVLDFYKESKLPESQRNPETTAANQKRMREVLEVVDAALGGREFLVGGHFTAADVVMASVLNFANMFKLLDGHPRLVTYVKTQTHRPAAQRAFKA